MSATVLVTEGEQRASLAVTRSLGRAGYAVIVCSGSGHSLAGASRYAQADVRVTPVLQDPARHVAEVSVLARERGVQVVLPMTDASMLTLLGERDRLGGDVIIPFSDLTSYRALADKQWVLARAAALGMSTPAQTAIGGPGDGGEAALTALPFPLVVKPSRSVAPAGGTLRHFTVRYASDRAELAQVLEAIPEEGYPVLLQARVVGPGVGVFLFRWEGEVRARFAHRRLREKPPSGGVSVYSESVPLPRDLVEQAEALLAAAQWQGVAMVEFKIDRDSGTAYLMEVNGRFWGSLQLAIDAGVDFPRLLVRAALGEALPGAPAYRVGLRERWWWGDVDQMVTRLRHSGRALALPPDDPGTPLTALRFLRLWWPGDRNEVFRWSDPGPFLRETAQWGVAR